jgi:tetratricopeptide (TPR) repeat protein
MECSRALISDTDTETQSCCFRFIGRCHLEGGNLGLALSAAEDAIHRNPKCAFGYLLKFRVLGRMGRIDDISEMISQLLKTSPFLETFEPEFFTSAAAELHEFGNRALALDCLLALIEKRRDIPIQTRRKAVVSIFALLQGMDDHGVRLRTIRIVAQKWVDDDGYDNPTRTAFVSIAYATGVAYEAQNKFSKARSSFANGVLVAGEDPELRGPCSLEEVKCLIKMGGKENLEIANRLLEDLAPRIEKASQALRDGLLLARIKVGIAEGRHPERITELVDEVASGDVLAELCIFIGFVSANRTLVRAILQRARMLASSAEVVAAILHQLVVNAKSKEELRESYELMIDCVGGKNWDALTGDQLQFFMAKAWNTGVQLARARRGKEAEWWFTRALEMTRSKPDLRELYEADLDGRFGQFLEHERSRMSLQF